MFIRTIFYKTISPDEMNLKKMSAESVQYLSDLYANYRIACDIDMSDSIYHYEQTALHLFNSNTHQKICQQSDYLLFPCWGFACLATQAMPILSLRNRYAWKMPILDVQDCGSLCVYHAIFLLHQLHHSSAYEHYTCCTIENALRVKNQIYPEIHYVGLLHFEKHYSDQSHWIVLHCEMMVERKYDLQLGVLLETLSQIANHYGIEEKKYHVMINNYSEQCVHHKQVTLFFHPPSSGFLYFILHAIQNCAVCVNTEFIFIVDFDYQTQSCGTMLIGKNKKT